MQDLRSQFDKKIIPFEYMDPPAPGQWEVKFGRSPLEFEYDLVDGDFALNGATMPDFFYISLKDNIETLWPRQFIPQPSSETLESIWLEPLRIITEPAIKLRTAVLLTSSIELGIPGLNNHSLVLGHSGNETTFIIEIELETIMLGRLTSALAIRFRNNTLRPARVVRNETTGLEAFEIDYHAEYLDVLIGNAAVSLDQNGNISINSELAITIPHCAVGDTGLVIEARNVSFDLRSENPVIVITEADILLPNNLPIPPDTRITMNNARIDSAGFTGEVSLDLALEYDQVTKDFKYPGTAETAKIFGIPGGLRHVGIRVEQNQLTGCDISGAMVIPYFDKPVDIRLDIQPDGSFTITLLNLEPDKPLTKDELLELYLESLQIGEDQNNNVMLIISGGLKPLLQSSDGMGWPRLDVKDLLIDSTGKFSIKEAWLDLTERKPLDLYGFTLDLDRIGLGTEIDKMWIDLSGSLRLLPQIPVGLGVEGVPPALADDFA